MAPSESKATSRSWIPPALQKRIHSFRLRRSKLRIHRGVGLAIELGHPVGHASVLQIVIDLVANLAQRFDRDFVGAQQVIAIRLLQRLGSLPLLQLEDRGAEGIRDVVAEAKGGEVAILVP